MGIFSGRSDPLSASILGEVVARKSSAILPILHCSPSLGTAGPLRTGARDLGDITGQNRVKYKAGHVGGTDDSVDYFAFTITEKRHVSVEGSAAPMLH